MERPDPPLWECGAVLLFSRATYWFRIVPFSIDFASILHIWAQLRAVTCINTLNLAAKWLWFVSIIKQVENIDQRAELHIKPMKNWHFVIIQICIDIQTCWKYSSTCTIVVKTTEILTIWNYSNVYWYWACWKCQYFVCFVSNSAHCYLSKVHNYS